MLAMGVGGVFDVSGRDLQRAPLWMRNHRLEWAYRLYLQPSRIGRMAAIPKFMLDDKKWKRKNGNKIWLGAAGILLTAAGIVIRNRKK